MKQKLKNFRLRCVCVAAGMVLLAHSAWAVTPFTLGDIQIEGLQRTEPGTIFGSLPFRVGDTYNDDKGSAAIRALFGLGLFADVRLEVKGNTLIVVVQERPTVADVNFVGAGEFDKDALRKSLRDIGLGEGRPYDQALIDRAEQELKRQYINRSLYAAEIVTTITPIERNRVNVSFNVTEGEPARLKEIRIVGNEAFSQSTLRGLMDLDTSGWMSWYTKSDRYSRAKLNADLETLRAYYLARGYLEFRIDSTQVAISPNKQDISVTVNITEGQRFVVSGVRLEGDYLGKDNEFKSQITIRPGEPFNAERVAETTKAFTDYFGNFGFAFATVDARPEIDRANNRVTLTLLAEPGRRAYVRRVNVTGNNRTRDEVVRREFRQFESAWYDGDKIRASRDRIDRLGYFKDVNVETADVPGAPDQVDLVIAVVEKPTGSLQLGAGVSSAEKLTLSFAVKQDNIFGSGNYLGVELNTGKFNRTLVLSSVNPYFTEDGVSRAADVYYRTTRPYSDQGGTYELVTQGVGLRFGVPFSELDTVYFGAAVERTSIQSGTNLPATYAAYANQFGYASSGFPLSVGWARDDRDSALVPTRGRLFRLNADVGLAGDTRYVRGSAQYQLFLPLSKSYTLAFNGELGWGKGLSGRPYPVFKNFYSGGLGSVRGFEQGSLGPRDLTGSLIGGPKKITLNAEFITPFPGIGNDRSLRLFAFYDLGNVFGESEKFTFSDLRSSAGIGVSWLSPIGPLRFAAGQPLRKFAGDRIQKFQFQIGTSF